MTRVVEGRVSVIVPVFEMGRFLPDAIASIEAQQHDDIEIIVIDDGSSDDTPQVIAALGDRVLALRQDNRGPAAARNAGLALATGSVIAFLDADDLWPAGKLARQLDRLEQDPELDAVLGRIQYVALDGGEMPDIEFEDRREKILSHVHLGSGLYRRRVFDRLGHFDEGLRHSEDIDWFFRAREAQVRMTILPDVTLVYRLHGMNMTLDPEHVRSSYMLTTLKNSLDRRRAAGISGDLAAWRTFDEREPDLPTVSVIIPAFNAAKYLREAIRSVVEQTHQPLEIIVVDDGSSDATALIASRFAAPVRVLRRPHRGIGASRNAGFAEARGEYIASLDADDLWAPSKLAEQLALFASDPTLDIVFAGVEQFVSPELEGKVLPERQGPSASGRTPSAVLMRASVVERVGPYREDVVLGEFLDWYDRAIAAGCRVDQADALLVRRRIHDANNGIGVDRGEWAVVVKDMLDRRRAAEDRAR
jgi:glycosyltransferase involved in cell wall biosynthesis